MTARPDRIEVVPTKLGPDSDAHGSPLSRQPHFVRRIDGSNGKTESTRQTYTRRDNAVRAAIGEARAERLHVVILDRKGNVIRTITHIPMVTR